MMKRIMSLLAALLMIFAMAATMGLSGCGGDHDHGGHHGH
jgi:hypothetical protein